MSAARSPADHTGDPVRAIIALTKAEIGELLGEVGIARLSKLLPDARWVDPDNLSPNAWAEHWRETRPQVLVSAWRTPSVPADAVELEYVCHLVGSVRLLIPRQLMIDGLTVTNWGAIAAPIVAEHALLLILGALRSAARWPAFMSQTHTHEGKNSLGTKSLYRRRVAIHGFGGIARALVQLLKPFDVSISAYSAGVPDELMRQHGVMPMATLASLAEGAEIFVCCEALTDSSRHSIDASILSRLLPGGVFVNVGRGAIVDETALVRIAKERSLRVASDVVAHEPLSPDSPLRTIPGSWYSPHIAGPTLDQYARFGDAAIDNLRRFIDGLPLENLVNLEAYDRST